MCQVVVTMQLTAGGHYHDVKYPKCVYTELDTLPPYLLACSVSRASLIKIPSRLVTGTNELVKEFGSYVKRARVRF